MGSMNLLERCLGMIAPHICFVCGQEGSVLCADCQLEAFRPVPSRCYRCHAATRQSRSCQSCRRKTPVSHVWASTRYFDQSKELIRRFKFERAKQAAGIVAEAIDQALPILPGNILVAHVPTANSRVRARGYDQARLVAQELCRHREWQYASLLLRRGSARQLGARRSQRFTQLENAFSIRSPELIAGAHILLIDDVLTTGATLEAAARALKQAGAKTIDAAVFAQP